MKARHRKVIYLLALVCVAPAHLIAQQQTPSVSSARTASEGEKGRNQPPLSGAVQTRIAKMTPLFDGKTLDRWIYATNAWTVKDGAMASLGAGRGVIYTQREFTN